MDFIEGLPKSEGKDTILMVVCKLTKYGYVIPLSHPFTTSIVFKFFVDHVLNYMEQLHGAPESIVFDRGKVFTSLFWKDLFKCIGITFFLAQSITLK